MVVTFVSRSLRWRLFSVTGGVNLVMNLILPKGMMVAFES
jgi:hypothetical protein